MLPVAHRASWHALSLVQAHRDRAREGWGQLLVRAALEFEGQQWSWEVNPLLRLQEWPLLCLLIWAMIEQIHPFGNIGKVFYGSIPGNTCPFSHTYSWAWFSTWKWFCPRSSPTTHPSRGYLPFDKNSGDLFGYVNWKGGPCWHLVNTLQCPDQLPHSGYAEVEKLQQGNGEGTIPCILLSVLVGG